MSNIKNVELHTHNGVDSPKVNASDIINAAKDNEVVKLTGNQTIAGIKTFSSIPVLPASNPTTDNQATRKKYVDDLLGETEVYASDTVRDSANTQRDKDDATYTKWKEITYNEIDGDIRVYFEIGRYGSSGTVYGRIYVNDVAVGTERSTTGAITDPANYHTEDISVEAGDDVQLCVKIVGGGAGDYVRFQSFQLKYDKRFAITAGTINMN